MFAAAMKSQLRRQHKLFYKGLSKNVRLFSRFTLIQKRRLNKTFSFHVRVSSKETEGKGTPERKYLRHSLLLDQERNFYFCFLI